MKFKKGTKKGECSRMRCNKQSSAFLGNYEVCADHYEETKDHLSKPGTTVTLDETVTAKDAELEALRLTLKEVEDSVPSFPLDTSEDFLGLVAVLHDALDQRDEIDSDRKVESDPHHKAFKAVNDKYRPALNQAESLAASVKTQILAFRMLQEEEQDADGSLEVFGAPGLSFPPAELQVKVADLSAVPEEFLTVAIDMAKIEAYCRANPQAIITGLEIDWKREVSFRRPPKKEANAAE
jgi:hypothetical protein